MTRSLTLLPALLVLWSSSLHAQTARTVRDLQPLADRVAAVGEELPPEKLAGKLDEISDDPITLMAIAENLREADAALAAKVFERALEKEEINRYEKFAGSSYARAVAAEAAQKFDESRAIWRESAQIDPLTTYILLSRTSRDTERDKLLAEIRTSVEGLVAAAKAGNPAPIYTTYRGKKYHLSAVGNEEAVERLVAGEGLSYAVIDELDLTGKVFAQPVSCSRCVVGTIKGWESKFTAFSFRGFVLGDLHVGKAWTGEVNRSRSLPAATFDELLLDKAVILGKLEMDSVEVAGAAGFPFTVVGGEADLRNARFGGDLDMRFSAVGGPLVLAGAQLGGPAYFGHLHAGGRAPRRREARSCSTRVASTDP